MYTFVLQYESSIRPNLKTFLDGISDQLGLVRKLYAQVRAALEKDMSDDELAEFTEHVGGITSGLLEELERRFADETAVFLLRLEHTRTSVALKRLRWMPETVLQTVEMHLFSRWKLRKPLTRVVVPPVLNS
jgi:hypothetical protein